MSLLGRRTISLTGARCPGALLAVMIAGLAVSAHATSLTRGEPLPELKLTTVSNKDISTNDFIGTPQVILFGKSEHDPSLRACNAILHSLQSPELQGDDANWIYILSKSSDLTLLNRCWDGTEIEPYLVHDTDRAAFGAYGIITLPTAVVIDDLGNVVYILTGQSPRFEDVVSNAILLASNKIDADQFEQVINPKTKEISEARIKAGRKVKMARQIAAKGMDAMACSQYAKAIEIDPSHTTARLELGYLLLKQSKLDEAEQAFKELVDLEPTNYDGKLGLATILIARDGEHLPKAESMVREILAADPNYARAHYTLGLLFEKKGEFQQAANHFKTAASLLLN